MGENVNKYFVIQSSYWKLESICIKKEIYSIRGRTSGLIGSQEEPWGIASVCGVRVRKAGLGAAEGIQAMS